MPELKLSDAFPMSNTKSHHLLQCLLAGVEVGLFYALMELGIQAPGARCAELRKLGWPIRAVSRPHPKLEGEEITVYILDLHFRAWYAANKKHPKHYEFNEGRGKFAVETKRSGHHTTGVSASS